MKFFSYYSFLLMAFLLCNSDQNSFGTVKPKVTHQTKKSKDFKLKPIEHATASFSWAGTQFYIDPVGGEAKFAGEAKPTIILITDIHADHMDAVTLSKIMVKGTKVIVPEAVANKLPIKIRLRLTILANGQTIKLDGFKITGIPMYNLREEAKNFHTKGRGNGYVIEKKGMRVYFSGDTEDIPEMRNLKNIDKAFVCMNLPYTMTVESAANAVLAFKPKQVYPYHYRGADGLSNVAKFKELVNKGDSAIEVVQLNWYPGTK